MNQNPRNFQICLRGGQFRHTSRISSVGIWGKKSFPTKKHMKIKSSTMHSTSILKERLGILISYSRYSLRVQMLRNCKMCTNGISKTKVAKNNIVEEKLPELLKIRIWTKTNLIRFFSDDITFLIKLSCLSLRLSLTISCSMTHLTT